MGVKRKRIAKYSDVGHVEGYIILFAVILSQYTRITDRRHLNDYSGTIAHSAKNDVT